MNKGSSIVHVGVGGYRIHYAHFDISKLQLLTVKCCGRSKTFRLINSEIKKCEQIF